MFEVTEAHGQWSCEHVSIKIEMKHVVEITKHLRQRTLDSTVLQVDVLDAPLSIHKNAQVDTEPSSADTQCATLIRPPARRVRAPLISDVRSSTCVGTWRRSFLPARHRMSVNHAWIFGV